MATAARMHKPGRHDAGARLLDAFAATRPELVGALTNLLGSQDDAQDAAQTTFLKCWRARRRLRGIRDLRAWVFRVGLNAGRDLRRDAWRQRSRPLAALTDPPAPMSNAVFDREACERLRIALADLRPAEREVFLLRQHSDRTYDEIAALHCVPVGTVKTRMRAALQKLRAVLQEQ